MLMLADVVQDQNIRMSQRPHGLGFLLEPRQGRGVRGQLLRQNLKRYLTSKPGIARSVDLPHTASANLRQDVVGTKFLARNETRHGIQFSLSDQETHSYTPLGAFDHVPSVQKASRFR